MDSRRFFTDQEIAAIHYSVQDTEKARLKSDGLLKRKSALLDEALQEFHEETDDHLQRTMQSYRLHQSVLKLQHQERKIGVTRSKLHNEFEKNREMSLVDDEK